MNVNFSYSAYTDLRRVAQDGGCPRKWHEGWINKNKPEPSEAMLLGRVFEQLCGVSPSDDLIEIPRTKQGSIPAAWQRMLKQVEVFKELFNPDSKHWLGYTIAETQNVLFDEARREKGILDFTAIDQNGYLRPFELKLTADLTNTWGEFAWGDLSQRDWLQILVYTRLLVNLNLIENFRKNLQFGTICVFNILVFDYSTSMNKKLIPIEISEEGIASVEGHVGRFWDMLEHYSIEGWFEDPSPKECKNCPLKDSCSSFIPEEKEEKRKTDLYQIFIEETIKI